MFDQAGMVRELCKWDYELRNGEQLEAVIDRAIEIATSEPCGPVYLSLPREVMSARDGEFHLHGDAAPRLRHGAGTDARPDRARRRHSRAMPSGRSSSRASNARVAANAHGARRFRERFAVPLVEYRSLANSLPTDHPMLLGYDPGAAS